MPLETPRAQFRQLADQLRAGIERGDYPPGSTLPSEPDLAAEYGVSRHTVNQAMALLRSEGVARVERGRGTVVRARVTIHRDGTGRYQQAARERDGGRGAFDTEIRALGMVPRSETEVSPGTAPAEVAAVLGSADVIVRRRKMYADDVPVQLAPSYIPLAIAEGTPLAEADSGPGGIISRFAELGYAQTRITESVSVRRPDDVERSFLQMEPDQPVIEIMHTGWTAAGQAVEVAVHVVPASDWILDYSWPVS